MPTGQRPLTFTPSAPAARMAGFVRFSCPIARAVLGLYPARIAARALGPAPGLVLAMALHKSRQEAEARKTLAAAILGHDWRPIGVRDQDDWIRVLVQRWVAGIWVEYQLGSGDAAGGSLLRTACSTTAAIEGGEVDERGKASSGRVLQAMSDLTMFE
jgi:hypothetical protein